MVRHIGYAVCEGSGHVVPLESHYARREYAGSLVRPRVMDAYGLEATAWRLWPAGEEEAAIEAIESAVADSCGYEMCLPWCSRPA